MKISSNMSQELLVLENYEPHNLHKALLMVVSFSKKSFVTMGKILYELKNEDKWRDAVGDIETWSDYLKQPEIGLSIGEANRLIQIYETFVIRLEYDEETVSEIPLKSMHYLLPLAKDAKNREEIEGLVDDAINLSQKDFKERLYESKTNNVGTKTFSYFIMRRTEETSTMDKVPEISSEELITHYNLPRYG